MILQRRVNEPSMIRIISFGKTMLMEERFIKPINSWVKPIGGLWGSTYIPDEVYSSEWEKWCINENFGYKWQEAVIFTLKPDANIYEIDSVEDLNNLALEYNTGQNGIITHLDFEAMVDVGIDAIHLTERGQEVTRFSRPYSLYGWDCESWLILKFDAIDHQKPVARTQMAHLIDQISNAKTATGISAAIQGFRVAISGRGCGKLAAIQKELQELARIGEENYKREGMGIISDDGMDGIRYALSAMAASMGSSKEIGIAWLPEEIDKLGPSPAEIKRKLKYAKNPMEIKKLNQELTAAYKRYKGGSRIERG